MASNAIRFFRFNDKDIAYLGDPTNSNVIFIIGRSNSYKYSAPLDNILNFSSISSHVVIWSHWPNHEKDFEFKSHLKFCKELLESLGNDRSVVILSHSVGGRIAANLASEPYIEKIICFGYPFKHPDEPEDQSRTNILRAIKTPLLIIQGRSDEYGGVAIQKKYLLSEFVKVVFVNADHDYENLSDSDWDLVTGKLKVFINLYR